MEKKFRNILLAVIGAIVLLLLIMSLYAAANWCEVKIFSRFRPIGLLKSSRVFISPLGGYNAIISGILGGSTSREIAEVLVSEYCNIGGNPKNAGEKFRSLVYSVYSVFGGGRKDFLIGETPLIEVLDFSVGFDKSDMDFADFLVEVNGTLSGKKYDMNSLLIIPGAYPLSEDSESLYFKMNDLDILDNFQLNGTFYAYFFDWMLFEGDSNKISYHVEQCHVSAENRMAAIENGQASGFFNSFSPETAWENSDEVTEQIISDREEGICRYDNPDEDIYLFTECGRLKKSMLCCKDKVILCYVPHNKDEIDALKVRMEYD